jgi:hemerythrin superfamily protein
MEKQNPLRLRDALLADHRRLDALFEKLLEQVHLGDTALADATWTELERGLLGHLEAEEQWILPGLDSSAPAVTAAIRADHEAIRRDLAELGIELEIHTLREETAARFIAFLRAHAAGEEEVLYRIVDRTLAQGPRASVLERLRLRRREEVSSAP